MTDNTTEIRMGRGLAAPERAVSSSDRSVAATSRPRAWRRIALVCAALSSPLAMAAQYALNSAGLPRQDAEIYLAAVAADRGGAIASTTAYAIAMAAMVAVGALAAIALRRTAPTLSAIAASLLTLGAVGGGAFVGLRLAAVALVDDGQVPPGGVVAFTRLQEGVINPVALLLGCAILGTFTLAAAMLRSRRTIGWWPAAATLVGFVLASGEFPTAVSVVGALIQGSALIPVARHALAAER